MAVIQPFAMELSFPYNAIMHEVGVYDREWDANDFAADRATFLSDGVFANPSDNFKVQALNGNMTVTIGQTAKLNTAFIQGRSCIKKGQMIVDVPNAHTQYSRLDIVTLRHSNLAGTRRVDLHYRSGTPSASPTAPALIRDDDEWEIQLAQITVAANAQSITQANVSDSRLNSNLCGIVTCLGNVVDTTAIFNQYQTYLNQKITEWNKVQSDQATAWNTQMANQQSSFTAQHNSQKTTFDNWFAGAQADLVLAAQFYFDNQIMMPGTTYRMTKSGNTITEMLTRTSGGTKPPKRQ